MVLFVDLDSPRTPPTAASTQTGEPKRHAPNRENPLSALLASYPFLASLAGCLDHNDLYNLSSACWQFHANLAPYRRTLLGLSLRCSNDAAVAEREADGGEFDWRRARGGRRCARDLVKGCLRCGTPICRNCIHKPHVEQIHSRHRRLCPSCRITPTLLTPTQKRCTCLDGGWLCVSCAPEVMREDNAYRIWSRVYVRQGNYVVCGRGTYGCEGDERVKVWDGSIVVMGEGRVWAAPVEWDVEMQHRWALTDEWQGLARSWCNWCNAVIFSKEDESKLDT